MRTWTWAVVVVALFAACTGDPAPKTQKPLPPDQNDPAFSIDGLRHWYLIGDGTPTGRR